MQNITKLRIEFSTLFNKKLSQLSPAMLVSFKQTLDLFIDNPYHKAFRRHFLKKEYGGFESIDITEDYRAIFKQSKVGNAIVTKFYNIGTNSELYGRL